MIRGKIGIGRIEEIKSIGRRGKVARNEGKEGKVVCGTGIKGIERGREGK